VTLISLCPSLSVYLAQQGFSAAFSLWRFSQNMPAPVVPARRAYLWPQLYFPARFEVVFLLFLIRALGCRGINLREFYAEQCNTFFSSAERDVW